ncbi:hypothetical protein AYL99_08289 [Fonsecaea erecta]|uniref:Uncharacterized protein n=1 Tax=Fonsecaea erecta TaxID=1367422 RepID=A0A178ZDM2_9EURO|nr:hypothetical protein AYL99_08289 [Fonsecaea erecta]OAP57551.1 hypothetical protein AYL99_08289 [Fonsecaea erecta]
MSFGFSVSDFLAVADLLESTRKRFKGAPAEYNALADETRTLQIVVNDIRVQVEDDEIAHSIKVALRSAKNNCESVLKDLNAVIDAHTELGSAPAGPRKIPRRIWKRLRWDPTEAEQLRLRLNASVHLLVAVRQSVDRTQQRDIAQDLKKLTVSHNSSEMLRVADWLAPDTYSEHQRDYFTRVQAGTGQWVFADPRFCNWFDSRGPSTLLLPGIPGAGKTFVASIIIDRLQAHVSQDDTCGLVFFYSSFKRPATQSCRHIVFSMVRQLYLQQSRKNDVVKSVYEEHIKRQPATSPSLEEACTILEQLLLGFSAVNFVIDALDECKGPEGSADRPWNYIPSLLFRLQEKLKSQMAIKLLATSRPDLEIDGIFLKAERLIIYARDDDLGKFCDSLIPNIRCVAHKTELHPKIKRAICESAGGMFLLAQLHCDTLAAKTKPKDVLRALEAFGRGGDALDRAYQDTLTRIQSQPEEYSVLAKKVLVCITYSAEPLTLDQVRHALAVDQETRELDPEYDLDNPDDVVSSCAGLVTIDSESKIIRLVHYTTQSFLESLGNRLLSDPHDFLASCCLDYLHLDVFARDHGDWYDGPPHSLQFPFLKYSVQYWNWHLSSGSGDIALRQKVFSFLDDSARVTTALYSLNRYLAGSHASGALHLLATMGLNDWIGDYINRGPPTDWNGSDQMSCIECRRYGPCMTDNATPWVTWLTSWSDSFNRTPLSSAIREHHESTAILLIDLNNKVLDEVDVYGRNPLHYASSYDLSAVALKILEKPEKVSWYQYRDPIGRTLLCVAALYGLEAVVDRLLELVSAFAYSDAISYTTWKGPKHETPLWSAARMGHLGIVKKLLANSRGRELNLPNLKGETPLHAAVRGDHLEVIQYLMSQDGIETDRRDLGGCSALHLARSRHVIEYLLSTGLFSADSTDFRGQTVLIHAVLNAGLEAVVYLTSRQDVDVNGTDQYGMNALMAAASIAFADAIAHLAPLVRDVDSTDKAGRTTLHYLCLCSRLVRRDSRSRFQARLDALVRNGASLDIKNNDSLTPYDVLRSRWRDSLNGTDEREILEGWMLIMESYMSATAEE